MGFVERMKSHFNSDDRKTQYITIHFSTQLSDNNNNWQTIKFTTFSKFCDSMKRLGQLFIGRFINSHSIVRIILALNSYHCNVWWAINYEAINVSSESCK